MPNVSVTPADVFIISGTRNTRKAAEAINAGDVVYLDAATNNEVRKAAATSQNTARCEGIAINSAAAGQYVTYAINGSRVTIGTGALTQGEVYVVSATSGQMAPESDLVTGNYLTIMGTSPNGNDIILTINATGITKP